MSRSHYGSFTSPRRRRDVWGVTEGWREPAVGWVVDSNGQFPYISNQAWGAWLVLGLTALWTGRGTFKAYLWRAIRGDKAGLDADEPMSARIAVVGFLAGFLALCAFVWSWGGSWWLPVVFLGIYLLLMVTLSRIRAETAVLSTELMWVNPQSILTGILGSSSLSHADLAHTASLSWFNLDYRAAAMPHELESFVGYAAGRRPPQPPGARPAAGGGGGDGRRRCCGTCGCTTSTGPTPATSTTGAPTRGRRPGTSCSTGCRTRSRWNPTRWRAWHSAPG